MTMVMTCASQFTWTSEACSAAVVAVFGFAMAIVWFKLSNLIVPLRVSCEVEIEGLDSHEMGAHGYPEFAPAEPATSA